MIRNQNIHSFFIKAFFIAKQTIKLHLMKYLIKKTFSDHIQIHTFITNKIQQLINNISTKLTSIILISQIIFRILTIFPPFFYCPKCAFVYWYSLHCLLPSRHCQLFLIYMLFSFACTWRRMEAVINEPAFFNYSRANSLIRLVVFLMGLKLNGQGGRLIIF